MGREREKSGLVGAFELHSNNLGAMPRAIAKSKKKNERLSGEFVSE